MNARKLHLGILLYNLFYYFGFWEKKDNLIWPEKREIISFEDLHFGIWSKDPALAHRPHRKTWRALAEYAPLASDCVAQPH